MSDLMTKQRVSVVADLDMIRLSFGSESVVIPYQTAIEVANGIKMAGKLASRHEGNSAQDWRDFIDIDNGPKSKTERHRGFRRSNVGPNVREWTVGWDGAVVKITFDQTTVGLHYSDALECYNWLRVAYRDAKAWAGDTGKIMRTTAYLNDAEQNYKHGFH